MPNDINYHMVLTQMALLYFKNKIYEKIKKKIVEYLYADLFITITNILVKWKQTINIVLFYNKMFIINT